MATIALSRLSGSTEKRTWLPSRVRPVTPAMPSRLGTGPRTTAEMVVVCSLRISPRVPTSTMRPARMMLMRSHSLSTSDRMWLDSRIVRPWSLSSRAMSENTASMSGSRPAVGSSSRNTSARRQGCDERDLLPVALGVAAALLGRVEVEALEQRGATVLVEVAAQPAEQVDDLAAGEVRPQGDVAGDVRDAAMDGLDVGPGVGAQQRRGPAVGLQQAQEDADRRGLAGAVGAEESVHLALLDRQVEPVERAGASERLGEFLGFDDSGHAPTIRPG